MPRIEIKRNMMRGAVSNESFAVWLAEHGGNLGRTADWVDAFQRAGYFLI
jgi:hypothetical protein